MNKLKLALLPAYLLTALLTVAACGTDEATGMAASGDCIVTSATLGVLKKIHHTTDSNGNDSVYTTNVTGAYFPLHIDQLGGRIFNTDSLPVGTDVTRTVFATFNTQGYAVIRSLATGKDTVFVRTDSTDCSVERELTVHALDGVSKRTYRLSICVHREEADSFVWKQVCAGDEQLAALAAGHRTLAVAGRLHVFGLRNGQPVMLTAPTAEPTTWTACALPEGLDVRSVCRFGDGFVALADGRIATSTDGTAWTDAGSDFRPDALAGAGSHNLFAIKDGQFYSSADGLAWTADGLDAPEEVPAADALGIVAERQTGTEFENMIVVGRSAAAAPVVWMRNIDLTGQTIFPWTYLPPVADAEFRCPDLTNASLVAYDGSVVLSGTDADGRNAAFYQSRDNGRTWQTAEWINPATGLAGNGTSVAVDAEHFLWLVSGGSVWRGRINRLGWADIPGAFEPTR